MTRLPRAEPHQVGIPPAAVHALLNAFEREGHELHSLMIVRDGQVAVEGWWHPYRSHEPHLLYSLSKSFTSVAVGGAIAERRFRLDDLVIDHFRDHQPARIDPLIRKLNVRHLLTMTAGRGLENRAALRHTDDWPRAFLGEPVVDEPGKKFFYNSTATYMLSALVHRVTQKPLLEFLEPWLFGPLGIQDATWETDPRGVAVGGWGLSLRTEDVAKFGLACLQYGDWEGRPVLPSGWIADASRSYISTRHNLTPDWKLGYGYQFWRSRHGFRADGAFGQFCLMLPESRMVIVTTGRVDDLQGVLSLFWSILVPAVGQRSAADTSLSARLSRLALPTLPSIEGPPLARSFQCEDGSVVTVHAGFTQVQVTLGSHPPIEAGIQHWIDGAVGAEGEAAAVASCAGWISPEELRLRVQYRRSPANTELRFRFEGDQMELRTIRNGNLYVPPEGPRYVGRRISPTTG